MTSEVLTGLSVLVLEDEPLWRRHLVASLERWGAEVTATDSVAGARKALGSANFDFALMDVNLPDGLGPDLLRDKSVPAHTGVVIMTAEGGISGAVEAIRLGALDYLTKPFEPEALALTLRRARSTQAGRRVAEQQRAESPSYFFGNALAGLKTQIERILAADRRMETQLPPVLIEVRPARARRPWPVGSIVKAPGLTGPGWRSIVQRSRSTWPSRNSSGTRRVPSPMRAALASAYSKPPMAARCFSMSSAASRCPFRPSC